MAVAPPTTAAVATSAMVRDRARSRFDVSTYTRSERGSTVDRASLRRHYPDQVRSGRRRGVAASQPGRPSSPVLGNQDSRAATGQRFAAWSRAMRISRRYRFQSLLRVEMTTSVPMINRPYPSDRPRGPPRRPARRPERQRQERADLARDRSRGVHPRPRLRRDPQVRGVVDLQPRHRRDQIADVVGEEPHPHQPADQPMGRDVERHRPVQRGEHQREPGHRLRVRREGDADRGGTQEHPDHQHRVPEPHRHPEPRPRLEHLPVDPAGLLGPVVREDRVGLHLGQQAPEPERPEVGLARVDGRLDPLELGREARRVAHPGSTVYGHLRARMSVRTRPRPQVVRPQRPSSDGRRPSRRAPSPSGPLARTSRSR